MYKDLFFSFTNIYDFILIKEFIDSGSFWNLGQIKFHILEEISLYKSFQHLPLIDQKD